MPRVEFGSIGQVVAWLDQMTPKRKFVGYFTEYDELIIQPTTSTAPVTYGYLHHCKSEDALKKVQEVFDIPILMCGRFEWNHDNTMKRE